jgi:RNA polymerase sigma factor (sigma-70 family)
MTTPSSARLAASPGNYQRASNNPRPDPSLTHSGVAARHIAVDQTAAVDEREELERLLGTLVRQQRAAIVLRYYLDLPDDRISDLLNCTAATVRSHISQALIKLRIVARTTLVKA